MSSEPQNQPIRRRFLSDRIMMLLLYKPSEKGQFERRNGCVNVRVSWFARQLKMNSSKLYDQFLFLQHNGFLKLEQSPWGYVRLRLAAPLGEDPWPEKSVKDYMEEKASKKS